MRHVVRCYLEIDKRGLLPQIEQLNYLCTLTSKVSDRLIVQHSIYDLVCWTLLSVIVTVTVTEEP